MQVEIPAPAISPPSPAYNSYMGKKLPKPRPKQGARLAQLRKAAGLSQYELAALVGVPQPNIAFWEMSEKPPRSDVLPQMAKALGVSVEELLDTEAVKKPSPRKGGPTGKVRKVFEEVSRLPRHQQNKILEFVSMFVKQYQQSKQQSKQG